MLIAKKKAMKKIISISFILFLTTNMFARQANFIKRMEPASWWSGMKQTELQVMLYGNDVSACSFSVKNKAIPVSNIVKTDNPNYMFVYLDTKHVQPGIYYFILKRGNKMQEIRYVFNLRSENSGNRPSYSAADAVYLVMPDRFANGNPKNDSVKGYKQGVKFGKLNQRQGGDIQGIIDHLDYIADFGMTAIWSTPLLEDNDTAYSYHHYACSNFYKIDPRFGTNQDYKRLGDSCHAKGLKLIMDIVPNHCGITHWWTNDLPAKDWYHHWPAFTRTNYKVQVQTDPHASKADRYQFENGWFDTNMPDLNIGDTLLFDYLLQSYKYWIEYAGVDGLRVDTYPYNHLQDVSRLMGAIREEYPNMNIVGECWVKTTAQMAYYQTGNHNRDGFDSNLPSVMDFLLKDVFVEAIQEPEAWNTGMIRFYDHFALDFAIPNTDNVMNLLDNHDMDRFSAEVDRDPKLYKMGLALLATVRGFPQLYYGDEIMINAPAGSYESARPTFPGGWPNDAHNAFTKQGRTPEENDIYDYAKRVFQFRKHTKALQNGKMTQFLPEDGLYVFFRYNDYQTVMVVVNNNKTDKSLDLSRFSEMNIHGKTATEITTEQTFQLDKSIKIPGKTVYVLDIH